jgi:hypothetical protein
LSRAGIDCCDADTIQALLRELTKLKDNTFEQWNKKETCLVWVPTSWRWHLFCAKEKTWIPAVLNVIAPPVDDGLELGSEGTYKEWGDEGEATRDEAARWMMTYIGMKFQTKFAKDTLQIGMLIHQEQMSAKRAFDMWSDANINTTQQRIVNQHFAAFYGHRLTVPKSEIRKLVLSFVEPKTATVKNENSKINRELDMMIEKHFANRLQHNNKFK